MFKKKNYFHKSLIIRKNENEKDAKKKGRRKISDLVCGQYTNACKLGAN